MEKWFVILDDHHLGPFSKDEIKQMYIDGEISVKAEIWNESMETPQRLNDFLAISAHVEKLVDKKIENKMPEQSIKGKIKSTIQELEEDEVEVQEIEIEKVPLPVESEIQTEKTVENKKSYRFVTITLTTTMTALLLLFFYNKFQVPQKIEITPRAELSLETRQYLQEKINNYKGKEIEFFFRLSKDKKRLWAATSSKFEGPIQIVFTSIEDKVLGPEVKFKAIGNLNKHLVEFDNIYFEKGARFIDGYYDLSILTPKGLEKKLFGLIKLKEKKLDNVESTKLIASVSESSFKVMHAQYKKELIRNSQKFETELVQKLQTIRMMVKQIIASLNRVKSDITAKIFEDEYKNNFGVFFTGFVIDNEDQYREISKEKFQDKITILNNYSKLTNLAKEIGVISTDAISDFSKTNDSEKIIQIRNESIKRLDKLIISTRNLFDL